ncbi:MAG: acyl-CoA dehydrogenase family protein [Nocardioidaceae bacterium]
MFIDEAHHVAARTWYEIRRAFEQKPVVQFTATPFREDGKHLQGRTIYSFPLREAQAQGYFSNIDYTAASAVEIEAMKLLTLKAAWLLESGADNRHASSMAKLYAGVKANEIVDRVLQIHGGMGYTRELPIERWYRELRLLRIYEGTDEIQRQSIARNVLKGNVSIAG